MPYGGAGASANPSQYAASGGGSTGGITGPVTITTTGSTFAPSTALAAGASATLTWSVPGFATQTGLTPSFSFGSAATRTVTLTALDSNGRNALGLISVFNVGYNAGNDSSPYSPSSAYNWTSQSVSGFTNVRAMTGLVYFLAEQISSLTGAIDFSYMGNLTNIELYQSLPTSVNVTGCLALIRLDCEVNALTNLDLNSLPNLADVRAANQNNSAAGLTFTNQAISLPSMYHFCTRDQPVYNQPSLSSMVHVNQIYTWDSMQFGIFKPNSDQLFQVQSYQNWWSQADLTNQFPIYNNGANCQLDLHQCALTSVTLTGCPGLATIDLSTNPTMTQATVDGILAAVDGFGTSNGTLNLGTTAQPSAGGLTHKTNLTGRGWTVTTDSSGIGGGGTKFTYKDSAMARFASGASYPRVTLAQAVASGDLLICAVEAASTPTIRDSSNNTWTVTGPFNSFTWLAYVLSAAANTAGLTVNATGALQLSVSRFTPTGVVTFGATASSTPDSGGLNTDNTQNLGNLGTVAAHALAWGVFFDDATGNYSVTSGWQTGTSGTPSVVSGVILGPHGKGFINWVPDCANTNASLTWHGSVQGESGKAVSAYFTST